MESKSVTNYRYKYKFCPFCGRELKISVNDKNSPSRLVCIACGFIDYQDPKLVVNTIIEFDGKIIMLKRDRKFGSGKWSFPGGYMDRGETLEGAAKREAKEECGVDIDIKYLLGLYSYYGKCEIVAIFVAKYLSGNMIAGDETSDIKLMGLQEIPWDNLAFPSITLALRDYSLKSGFPGGICYSADEVTRKVRVLLPQRDHEEYGLEEQEH
ncbi:MAG: NUDIX hydrolase [Deltaproteobacteria bacterium]|nr:NUDIX hydrolase [Deltaproteobacteria bacterium]